MGPKLRFPCLLSPVLAALAFAALERPPAALAAPEPPALKSPRLQQLWAQLQAGVPDAEAKFWAGLDGTPLVEPMAGDPTASLVTFLWQGKPETRHVVVSGGRPKGDWDGVLEKLPGTELWYRTERLPADARFTYSLAVDGPIERPDRIEEVLAQPDDGGVPDPRNSHLINGAPYVVLPQAPPFPYPANTAAAKGQLLDASFHSRAMDGDFALKVYLPPKPARPGPRPWLLVGLDAGFEDMGTVLDDLIATGQVPPLVAVGVVSRQGKRTKDLGYSDDFARFLADELVPWARRQYGTTALRDHTILGGESRGGGMVLYTALHHPNVAGKVLAISTALENVPGGFPPARYWLDPKNGWLIERILETPRRPVELFLTVGTLDTNLWVDRVVNSRRLRDVLRAKGYKVHYTESTGAHDAMLFQRGYVLGLPVLTRPSRS